MRTLLDDRRVLLPLLLTVVTIAIGSVLIVMLSGDASDGASSPASAAPAARGAVTVDIADFKFDPITVTVKPGSKITWVNHDTAPHTATATGPGAFDTDTLKKNE